MTERRLTEVLADLIVDVPDHPKPGIVFKDITPALQDPVGLRAVVDAIVDRWRDQGITCFVAIESRGFLFGAAAAYAMGVGVALVRKPGKLPRETAQVTYDLEYGSDTLEMHLDALGPDDRVVIVDDVLATGGTAAAAAQLVAGSGARLAGFAFVIELDFLAGRDKLGDVPIQTLLHIG